MKDTQELGEKRINHKIRKHCITTITDGIKALTTERLQLLADYCVNLAAVDEEALQLAEQQAVEICGYNPTDQISDHEWAAMLKRNEQSLKMEEEEKNVTRTEQNEERKSESPAN